MYFSFSYDKSLLEGASIVNNVEDVEEGTGGIFYVKHINSYFVIERIGFGRDTFCERGGGFVESHTSQR